MKDLWGSELNIGDEVALKCPIPRYSYMARGKVIGFTAKKVRIQIYEDNFFTVQAGSICLKEPNGVSKRYGDT